MKQIKRYVSLCLVICFAVTLLCACTPKNQPKGKNLIYIIGDGMGYHHIENTKLYMETDKLAFEDYYVGEVTTRSANNSVTDSAAAATALATGVKVNNDVVGITSDGKEPKNIMELSKERGRKTAIVTTDTLDGATPAGFSAHTQRRTDTYGIIEDQSKGVVDLLIGKYHSTYYYNQKSFTNNGYKYADSLEQLNTLPKTEKIVANINNVDSVYNPAVTDAVSLKSLVTYALDYLTESNDNAFTLMVEGAYIDKNSHNNKLDLMMYALMDLNDAVEYIMEWANGRDDTVVIFTADHETGGLGKAESKDGLANRLYTSKDHTSANVPLFLLNTSTTLTVLDNTDVYKIAENAVLGKDDQ